MNFRVDMKATDKLLGETWLTAAYFTTEIEAGQYIADMAPRSADDFRIVNVEHLNR